MRFTALYKKILLAALMIVSMGYGEETEITASPKQFYLPSCAIKVINGYDFFVSGSFIYWEPLQENMSLGLVSDSSDAIDLVNGNEVALNFKYKPGFKLSAGMQFEHDNWETYLSYTWFRGTEKASVNLNPNNTLKNLFPAWETPNFLAPQYHSGKESWTLKMDLLDWILARNNLVGKALCLSYFMGARAAIIKQHLRVDYINTNPSYVLIWPSLSIYQKTTSWGVGPEVGISSKWDVGQGIYLQALAELDLLFTQYDLTKTEQTDEAAPNRYRIVHNNANFLRAHTELSFGFGWGTYFYSNRYHLDLLADYGFQVFFDQNMFISTASTQAVGSNTYPNGNLYLQGLTLTARFDF